MKKLLAVILTLTFILGTSVIGVSAAQSDDYFGINEDPELCGSYSIGFDNPEGWDEVYVYAYNDAPNWSGAKENAPYPGEKLEKSFVTGHGEIYSCSFVVGVYQHIIFNDGTMEEIKIKHNTYKEAVYALLGVDKAAEEEYDYQYNELYKHYSSTEDEIPEYVLVEVDPYIPSPELVIDILGDRVLHQYKGTPFKYDYGVYFPEENKIMSLEDAYYKGIRDIDKAVENCPSAQRIGDVHFDGKLNIKDATQIQKILANIVEDIHDDLSEYDTDGTLPICSVSDFNRDKKITIQDATAIQKYLAKIDSPDKKLNEKLKYIESLDNEFYANDCILVTLNSTKYEDYELYHFPEFDFSKIEKLEDFDENKADTYVLYLEEPNHVNVVEAIKALWHRIGKDLESIDINGIVYPD